MRAFPGIRAAACCAVLSLAACKCGEAPKAPAPRPAGAGVADRPAILATLPPTRASRGSRVHLRRTRGRRRVRRRDGRQVSGRPQRARGQGVRRIGAVVLSPDGSRVATRRFGDDGWRLVVDGVEAASFDVVEFPVFSPDGAHVAYEAADAAGWHLVVDRDAECGTPERLRACEFSGDSSRIASSTERTPRAGGGLVVGDLGLRGEVVVHPRPSP